LKLGVEVLVGAEQTNDLFGNGAAAQLAVEQVVAKERRREMRALYKLAGIRPLSSEQVLRGLELINLTCRVQHKQRSRPVAPKRTAEMERAARALLEINMPAHVIEQLTGVTRNRLSRWLGARP
jgi:hypothetical protein